MSYRCHEHGWRLPCDECQAIWDEYRQFVAGANWRNTCLEETAHYDLWLHHRNSCKKLKKMTSGTLVVMSQALTESAATLNAEKLAQAAKLIEEVVKELNIDTHKCPTCGLVVKENWTEYQMNEQLAAAIKRIQEAKRRLQEP